MMRNVGESRVLGLCRQVGVVLILCAAAVQTVPAQAIYSCVDAKGRRLTSDRPLAECADREQRELTATGTTKRVVRPVMTAEERVAAEQVEAQALSKRLAEQEAKRRDRALLLRYPDRRTHDKERGSAQESLDRVIEAAASRVDELKVARTRLDEEMEFYKKDPSKAPAFLRRSIDGNTADTDIQMRYIKSQREEKQRTTVRFDEELVRLKVLWQQAGVVVPPKTGPSLKK